MPRINAAELSRPTANRQTATATRLVFLVAGLAMAIWAPLVPFLQARTGLQAGALGVLLLCLGGGSVALMPLAGALAARLGIRVVILVSAVPMFIALPVLAKAADPILVAAVLAMLGGAFGAIDVAMNMQAITVERASGRAMMSGFHAFFSLGGMTGAVLMTVLLGSGLSPLLATLCVVACLIVLIGMAAPALLPSAGDRQGAAFAWPRGPVLFLGALCCIAFLSEGAVLDWGALFLTSARGLDAIYGGMAYAVFSVVMTLGRFAGDRLVQRTGGPRLVVLSGACAAAGFALTTIVPHWSATLLGYALIGAGCSNVVPVLFTRAGRQTAVPEHVAVSAMTTLGYAGILAGPACLGFVAQAAGLPSAFLLLMGLQFLVAIGGMLMQ